MGDEVENGVRVVDVGDAEAGGIPRNVSEMSFEQKKQYNLSISGLTYKVVTKAKKKGEEATTKVLLNNIDAEARAGEILAVVGPSGAGKSTFLDAIAGRINPQSLEGQILANQKPLGSDFKRISGYVMQDDQLFPRLTVRETLMFSARLRLPGTMSHKEKQDRVEEMIQVLGLKSCAETRIGDDEVRGISGGEKRRTSIGVDLIHDPPVLFLDEPTSGLDSTSALNVVQILHNIASTRLRTIVLTIHQPSFRVLELIHSFLVLARGNVIYHGSYASMPGYFEEFGRHVPDDVNVLEYTLDAIEELQNSEEGLQPLLTFAEAKNKSVGGRTLAQLKSNMTLAGEPIDFASGFPAETATLIDRNARNILRTPELLIWRLVLQVIVALTLGSLFFNVGDTPKGVQQRASTFAFTLAFYLFTATEALPIFLKERQIFIRETSRGAYRTSSYVIANFLVSLPFYMLQVLLFQIIAYWMVGLAPTAGGFFYSILILFLTLTLANAYVNFWSAIVPNFIAGNTIVTATTSFFFLFSGFFVPKAKIPGYWIWLHYLSNFKYPLDGLLVNEYTARPADTCFAPLTNGTCVATNNPTHPATRDDVLSKYSAKLGSMWWPDFTVLLILIMGYRVFFYFALRMQSKQTRK